jgi:hypothetical protein
MFDSGLYAIQLYVVSQFTALTLSRSRHVDGKHEPSSTYRLGVGTVLSEQ